MGTITRGTKAGTGTTDFGSTTALSSEVNTDLNTIVNAFNGNIDANNLASNAVTTAKITDLSVTTGKLADLSVTTGKINDLAVTTGKLAALGVTTAKIAVGNTVNTTTRTVAAGSVNTAATITETDIAVADATTLRGGTVLLLCSAGLSVFSVGTWSSTITLRWYRDATKLVEVTYAVAFDTAGGATVALPMGIPPYVDTSGTTGSVVYKLTAQSATAVIAFETDSAKRGFIHVVELA